MVDLEATVAAAVERSRARGAECEVWLETSTQRERRAGAGTVLHEVDRTTSTAVVTTWRDGKEGCVVAMGPDAMAHAVDAALEIGVVLPPRSRVGRPSPRVLRPGAPDGPEEGTIGLPTAWLAALSGSSPLIRDVTLDDHHAVTAFGNSDGSYLERRTHRCVVQLRCATRDGSGALSRSFVGRDPAGAVAATETEVQSVVDQTMALGATPIAVDLPERVVMHGAVMARLLTLLAPSLCLDAVLERRSAIADRVGRLVAAPGLTLIDDAPGLGFPFDDEGTLTRPVRLVDDGRLTEFLSDVRTAAASGVASTGAGWRSSAGSEVRVRPAALTVGWDPSITVTDPLADGPTLFVLQATGMHISNDVTGEFSFGAVGLVVDNRAREPRSAGDLTVAGNVVDMLPRLFPVRSPIRYVPRSVGVFGSPDMGVRGLTVGR